MNYERNGATGERLQSDLQILEEKVLVGIPRGDSELRVTFTRARTGDGKEVAWHSIREYYQADDGSWRPTKKGITIRGKEIHAVTIALLRACASSIGPETVAAAKTVVQALQGRRS